MEKFSAFCCFEHFQKQLPLKLKKVLKKVPKAADPVLLPLALTIPTAELHSNIPLKPAPPAKMFLCLLKDKVVLGKR